MRAGPSTQRGECCDLPTGHVGYHLDREINFSWYGGYGGFNPSYDWPDPGLAQTSPEKVKSEQPKDKKCSCSLATIWAKGCRCGGN